MQVNERVGVWLVDLKNSEDESNWRPRRKEWILKYKKKGGENEENEMVFRFNFLKKIKGYVLYINQSQCAGNRKWRTKYTKITSAHVL